MLLHSIVFACRCARVQAEFEACAADDGDAGRRDGRLMTASRR